jgi:hypothetical protein
VYQSQSVQPWPHNEPEMLFRSFEVKTALHLRPTYTSAQSEIIASICFMIYHPFLVGQFHETYTTIGAEDDLQLTVTIDIGNTTTCDKIMLITARKYSNFGPFG